MSADPGEARLFVLAGPDVARSFPLGERTTLGRSSECDVVLRDRSISRKHAVLVCRDGAWFVQDLGSTNGVSKGGRRAERLDLRDGDEFMLGDLPLRLRLTAPPEPERDIEFTLDPPAPATPVAERSAQPSATPPALAEDEIEIEEPDADVPRPAAVAPGPTEFRPARGSRHTGFLRGDLAQQPFWLRTLVAVLVVVLAAALAYGAFRAVDALRAGL